MKKSFYSLAAIALCGLMSFSFVSCAKKTETSNKSEAAQPGSNRLITIDSTTIYGDSISNAIYKENDLTLVNIMATWCGPCVKEMPELQMIDEENNGFGVVGVVVDTFDAATGATIETAVKEAKNIAEKTGVKYPLTIPTQNFLEQTLNKAAALLPMSFIVDKDGNIVKGPIAGARSKSQWLDVLNSVKEGL